MRIKEIVVDIEYDTDSDPMERRKGTLIIPDPGIASDVVSCIREHMGDALKKLSSRRVFHRDKPFPGSMGALLRRHGWKIIHRGRLNLSRGPKYICPDCHNTIPMQELTNHLLKCGRGTKCNVVGCCVEREGTKKCKGPHKWDKVEKSGAFKGDPLLSAKCTRCGYTAKEFYHVAGSRSL